MDGVAYWMCKVWVVVLKKKLGKIVFRECEVGMDFYRDVSFE